MKHLLNQPGLVKLIQQAETYQALLELAQAVLPLALQPHLQAVSIDQQKLICLLDQAGWASKCRYFEQALLHQFNQNLPHLKLNQAIFKLIPDEQKSAPRKRAANRPDYEAAKAFKQLSEKVESKKLADALAKLSQRAQGDNS